jgi:hypothetical protein
MIWTPASQPPPLHKDENLLDTLTSDDVLAVDKWGKIFVAYMQSDEYYGTRWRTTCSEGWILNEGTVTHWMPLPPLPEKDKP